MSTTAKRVRVAAVQAAPVLFDGPASTRKAGDLVAKAATMEAQLIVFPEAFIPAYPRGLSFGFVVGSRTAEGREDWQRYFDNAVAVPGPQTELIGQAAKRAEAYVSIGVIEKDADGRTHTLYCTNLFFGPDGALLGKHRKLKPTGSERLIWGEGDGSTLTVVDAPFGRMGALICWENYMPLARAAMYQQGITLYLAPTADNREEWQSTVRHIALESRCFVISCNQYVNKSMYPKDLRYYKDLETLPEECCPGGSCIVNPFGQYVVQPVRGREDILLADLDMGEVDRSRLDFDPVGHYARPDVLELIVHA
ncbi:MAG: carbon-nitrogen hydrolase family protein [Oscillospiraceae bacterium]|jgi:nitrilase|nr:carbon-nitrogen hydrolase family protein [Oscillospiraceae bacterium]